MSGERDRSTKAKSSEAQEIWCRAVQPEVGLRYIYLQELLLWLLGHVLWGYWVYGN